MRADRLTLLVVFLFLLFASVPPAVFLAYYSGFQLPSLSVGFSIVATAGIFVIISFFIVAALVAVALRGSGKKQPAHYPWEAYFRPPREPEEPAVRPAEKAVAIVQPSGAGVKVVAAVAIALLLISVVVLAASRTGWLGSFFGNESNMTKVKEPVLEILPVADGHGPGFLGGLFNSSKNAFSSLKAGALKPFAGLKVAIGKIPGVAWVSVAGAAVALLLAGAVFYSYRSRELGEIPRWLAGWWASVAAAFSVVLRNRLKSMILALAVVVVAALIAAFVFREKFKAILPSVPKVPSGFSIGDAFVAVRDFALAYRLYILIGIVALVVAIAVLMLLERKKPIL